MILTQLIFVELKTRGPLTGATLCDVTNMPRRTVERALARLVQLQKVDAIRTRSRMLGYVYAARDGATMPGDNRGRPAKVRA